MRIKNSIYFILISIFTFVSCTEDDDILNPYDDRDSFIGTWNVIDTCLREAYSVNIVADKTNSSQVIIKNFWLIGYNEKPPYAIVAGSTITIPLQAMCNTNSDTVWGSGKLNKDKIDWEYTVKTGGDIWTCNSVYTKP